MSEIETILSDDSAKKQLDLLLEYYDIEKDDIEIEEGPEAMQTLLNGLIRAIRKGRIEVVEQAGELIVRQNLKHPPGEMEMLEYGVVGQKARMAMDKIKDSRAQERMCAFMGSLAGLPPSALTKLKGVDMGTMNRLATVFSMV